MPDGPEFVRWGVPHLLVLLLTVAIPAALAAAVAALPGQRTRWIIAALLTSIFAANKAFQISMGPARGLTWVDMLPLHLCDIVLILVVLTLLFEWQWSYELSYFWGLAGTLQALITPDLAYDWPHFLFVTFFISHSGIVAGILYTTFGLQLRPTISSIWRAWAGLWIYAAVVGLFDALTGLNYGYLCRKPLTPSLLDVMGPWPWYIVTGLVFALVFFWIYYAPFAAWDLWQARRRSR